VPSLIVEVAKKLPINHVNFSTTPTSRTWCRTRLGGAGQNNIMMDGISAMDTGNNGRCST
jgi:hypothetical protein